MQSILRTTTLALACLLPLASACSQPAEGKLDEDLIRRVVEAHMAETRACYEVLLVSDADASGVLAVDFTIDESGEVRDPVIHGDDLTDATLHDCMRDTMLAWKFPRPEGGHVTVTYPFLFMPNDPRFPS
ncbi:MAG TPA: AgmX/PglI C-terminal domain-containing protein [Nannocystis sp.]|jgi:hypothetical protein